MAVGCRGKRGDAFSIQLWFVILCWTRYRCIPLRPLRDIVVKEELCDIHWSLILSVQVGNRHFYDWSKICLIEAFHSLPLVAKTEKGLPRPASPLALDFGRYGNKFSWVALLAAEPSHMVQHILSIVAYVRLQIDRILLCVIPTEAMRNL